MEKNEIEKCQCECGKGNCANALFIHALTNGLVRVLIIFAREVWKKKANKLHLTKEANFTYNQACNFQKLRYFGLVARCTDETGGKKTGSWLVTRNGGSFLRGELSMPKNVITRRRIVIEKSETLVTIKDFPDGSEVYWQKEFQRSE